MASRILFACSFVVLINVVFLLPQDVRNDNQYRYSSNRDSEDRYNNDHYNDNRFNDGRYDNYHYNTDRYTDDLSNNNRHNEGYYNNDRYNAGYSNNDRYNDGYNNNNGYNDNQFSADHTDENRYNGRHSSECGSEYEYYERCPENVCHKECRDVKEPQAYCPERSSTCHSNNPRCLCIDGYYRNDHGRCVQYNECWENYSGHNN